jgi:hypothetical protein
MEDAMSESSTSSSEDEDVVSESNVPDAEESVEVVHGGRPTNTYTMGEAISLAFPSDMIHEDDEERDMFDDGLSDTSSSESDMSSNYEELAESGTIPSVRYLTISESGGQDDVSAYDDSGENDEYGNSVVSSDSEYNDDDSETETNDDTSLSVTHSSAGIIQEAAEMPLPEARTFSELRRFVTKDLVGTENKEHARLRWEQLALEEQKRRIEEEMLEVEKKLAASEIAMNAKENEMRATLEASGISFELFQEYESFCESLEPKFGQREGFSITCDADHSGSYILYDPQFELFKEFVEMPLNACNFRCEASIYTSVNEYENIVEFWPI